MMARAADIPVEAIIEAATDRLEDLLGYLYPGGVAVGGIYYCAPASRDDLGSFQVRLKDIGRKERGSWNRYSQKVGGGVLNLVRYSLSGETDHVSREKYAPEIRWLKDWLGLVQPETDADRRRREARAAAREADRRRADEARHARAVAHRGQIWSAAVPLSLDPPDLGAIYLREARRLPIDDIARPERMLRFCASLWHWRAHAMFPAIVAPVWRFGFRDGRTLGAMTAVHCTFLAPDGSGKAPVGAGKQAKLMRGDVRGGVVPIARGPSGLSLDAAARAGVVEDLVIGEGLETMHGVACAIGEARVWACLSLGNIGEAPIAHPAIGRVFVALENDVKPRALQTRDAVMAKLRSSGKQILGMRPWTGSDFADPYRR